MFKFKLNTRTVVYLAMFITCEIVLNRFLSQASLTLKIGLAFAPVALCAMSLGPIPGAIVGGVSDMLGAVAFPTATYLPGISLVNAMIGFVYGVFLYNHTDIPKNQHKKMPYVKFYVFMTIAILLDCALGLFVNTYWISKLPSGETYWVLFTTRIWQYVIGAPLRFVVIISFRRLAVMLRKLCHQK